MKIIFIAISALLFSIHTIAQTSIAPKPSPAAKVEQVVGLTDISVRYSRPGVKDRVIFGNIVPYGKKWRTGANDNTVITFGDAVEIAGTTLQKGSYGVYTIPNETSWEVIFYKDTDQWGVPKDWDDNKIALKTTVTPKKRTEKVETLTIDFTNIKLATTDLEISWEHTSVGITITVPTKEKTLKNIATLTDASSARDFYEAAVFHKTLKEFPKAKEYIDKAIAKDDAKPFWMLRQQSLIYFGLGDKENAIKMAKASLAAAKKADHAHYIKLNTDSLQEWGAL